MSNTQLIAEIIGASYIYQQQPALAQVSLTITRGSINVVVSNDNVQAATGEQFSPEGYLEHLKQQNAYSTFVSCDTIVIGLCGAGGAGACFAACIALTLTTGPGGLACAVVCGIIAAYGCAEAQRRICG